VKSRTEKVKGQALPKRKSIDQNTNEKIAVPVILVVANINQDGVDQSHPESIKANEEIAVGHMKNPPARKNPGDVPEALVDPLEEVGNIQKVDHPVRKNIREIQEAKVIPQKVEDVGILEFEALLLAENIGILGVRVVHLELESTGKMTELLVVHQVAEGVTKMVVSHQERNIAVEVVAFHLMNPGRVREQERKDHAPDQGGLFLFIIYLSILIVFVYCMLCL